MPQTRGSSIAATPSKKFDKERPNIRPPNNQILGQDTGWRNKDTQKVCRRYCIAPAGQNLVGNDLHACGRTKGLLHVQRLAVCGDDTSPPLWQKERLPPVCRQNPFMNQPANAQCNGPGGRAIPVALGQRGAAGLFRVACGRPLDRGFCSVRIMNCRGRTLR